MNTLPNNEPPANETKPHESGEYTKRNLTGTRTPYGIQAGAATVELACSDAQKGWVVFTLGTPKHSPERIQIYVTKTGKVRIHSKDGEWLPQPKAKTNG